jgi:glycosyltransferase involved in cell wall biosynthesis
VYTTNAGLESTVIADRETHLDDVRVTYFSYWPGLDWMGSSGWQCSPTMTRALWHRVAFFDVVLLPGIWSYPTAAASIICRKRGIPYVVVPHGMLEPVALAKRRWKKAAYYFAMVRSLLQNAAAISCLTGSEEADVRRLVGPASRTIVIRQGIDPEEFRLLPERIEARRQLDIRVHDRVILFLGRISWKKGLDVLAAGCGRLMRERDDVVLVVAGPDEEGYGDQLRRLLETEGIQDHVRLVGLVVGPTRLSMLAAADVFVLPSYSEGFSMAILEAMAAGVPAVVSAGCNFPELAATGSGLVVAANADEVAGAIKTLIEDDVMREAMGRRGREVCRTMFDVRTHADLLRDVLRQATDRSSVAA